MNTGATPQGCSGHKRSVTNDGTVYCANFSAREAAAHRETMLEAPEGWQALYW